MKSTVKSSKQQVKLDELVELKRRRRRLNPLEWFEPLRLQKYFHNAAHKLKCIFGGNRSGKTEEGAEYILKKGLEKKFRIWAVAETFADSVSVQQRKVWDLLPKDQIKYGYYDEINGFRNRKLILKNGTIITFKSYDQKREAFQSDDIDIIWNDEEPPYDIYREQRMRLVDRDGEMIITMTSLKGVTDLIQDLFEDHDVVESEYAPLIGKELPRIVEKNGVLFCLLWTTENPYISQERIEHDAKLMTEQEILSRIYGIPINLSGKIYMKMNSKIHVIPWEDAPLDDVTVYFVVDQHDRKPWAMAWIAVDRTGTGYTFDEWPDKNFNEIPFGDKTYDEYATLIRNIEAHHQSIGIKAPYRRIGDPNFGNKTVQLAERQGGQSKTTPFAEMKSRGIKIVDGIDALEAGHLKVREMLHYEKKGEEIVVQPKHFFCDNCHNSIRHHQRYSRKDILTPDGDEKDKAGVREKYKDFCDLHRYFWMSNPKYRTGGKVFRPNSQKLY